MGLILSNKGSIAVEGEVSTFTESPECVSSEVLSSSPRIKKSAIINLINHTHFTNGYIQAHIRDTFSGKEQIVVAFPEPCVKEILICRWMKNESFNPPRQVLLNLVINDGKSLVLAPVETVSITDEIFIVALTESGYLWNRRKSRRYSCEDNDIDIEIIQDYNRIEGRLKNFSSTGFCIKLDIDSFTSIDWLNPVKPFFVQLFRDKILYSGFCAYVKIEFIEDEHLIILVPEGPKENRIRRDARNPRLNLVPVPKVMFRHPFLNSVVQYDVADLSTSGFSVYINADESPLMSGLFIQELSILIAGNVELKCHACIVYQLKIDENRVKYGFSILDMDVMTYNCLFAILCKADNPNINFSYDVDIDLLWEFFFRSGFIYPKKYEMLNSKSSDLKTVYDQLYHKGQEVFTNITYQNSGRIFGHCSLIRAYQRSWMVHHLAALPTGKGIRMVGLHILNQVLNYIDTLFKLPSSNMDYLMFFYRPENRFSDYFFGGFYNQIKNPRIVSMDVFSYLSYYLHLNDCNLPGDLKLEKFYNNDLETLNNFYEKQSGGGLLIKALQLREKYNEEPFEETYKKIGLNRSCNVYSLKENQELKAVIIVDQSSPGLNMSELLNCIKIIVIDQNLAWNKLNHAINIVGKAYKTDSVSVMIYPSSYLVLHNIENDRHYNLWIGNSNYGYEYNNFLKQRANPRLSSTSN